MCYIICRCMIILLLILNLLILDANSKSINEYKLSDDNNKIVEGLKRGKRIAGGSDVTIEMFPYQVSLQREGIHMCGGAIISNRHILTATHCVRDLTSPYLTFRVVSGIHNLSNGGQAHTIRQIVMHSNYIQNKNSSVINDISILVLTSPMMFSLYQKPIAVAMSDIRVGDIAVVTGWGLTNTWKIPDLLQAIKMIIIDNKKCNKYGFNVPNKSLCAINQIGVGVCNGDSGGPLVYNNNVIGITSTNIPCALGYPDIFTNVYHYRDFINHVLKTF